MTTRSLGLGLSLWAFTFGCVHVAWALGWRGGVPDDAPPIAERPVFLTYDVVAAALMLGAAAVALLLILDRGGQGPWVQLTVVGSVLALLRGAPALVIDMATLDVTSLGLAADVWFTVAGVAGLFLAAMLRAARTHGLVTPSAGRGVR